MRQFDNRESWFDNERNPLIGRVHFYKLHTTDYEAIMDVRGYYANNPVFTNNNGQLYFQVFLKDNTDYTVVFEKYVGNADMSVDSDPQNWEFQYSCDNLYDVFGITVQSSAIQTINNIAELRNTNPTTIQSRDGRYIIALAGYNTVGDKPLVYYIWNANSVDNDDGGSVIKYNDLATGRWELVNTFNQTGIDVRHFGIFGESTRTNATDAMSVQINRANTYATNFGYPLYFPCLTTGTSFYRVNNLTLNNVIAADGVMFFGKNGTNSTIRTYTAENNFIRISSTNYFQGVFTITGPIVKTSWGRGDTRVVFNPTDELIIDSDIANGNSNRSFSNIVITCYANVSNLTLTNCHINSIGKLGNNCTFNNCTVKQQYFADNATGITVDNSCLVNISDWTDSAKYIAVKQQQTMMLDLENRVVSGAITWTHSDLYIKNAFFDNFVVPSAATANIMFENCNGNIVIFEASVNIIQIVNSKLTMDSAYNPTNVFISANSTVDFLANWNITAVINVQDSEIKTTNSATLTAETANAMDSTIQIPVTAQIFNFYNDIIYTQCSNVTDGGAFNFSKCLVSAPLYQYTKSTQVYFYIENNTFNEGGKHQLVLAGPSGTQYVHGSWIGNSSNTSYHFIDLDRTGAVIYEGLHQYTYENNTGKHTLQRMKAHWSDYCTVRNDNNSPAAKEVYIRSAGDNYGTVAASWKSYNNAMTTTDLNCYLTICEFFTVGIRLNEALHFIAYPPAVATIGGHTYIVQMPSVPVVLINGESFIDSYQGLRYPYGLCHYNNYQWKIIGMNKDLCAPSNLSELIPTVGTQLTWSYEIAPNGE